MQGLPVVLSGRDMIGTRLLGGPVAFSIRSSSGRWKGAEAAFGGEGPVGVVLCPSRELARQTHEVVSFFMDRLDRTPLRSTLIGGGPKQQQLDVVRRRGVHAVVATPGRFRDFDSRAINLQTAAPPCLDEGDRCWIWASTRGPPHHEPLQQTTTTPVIFPRCKKFQTTALSLTRSP